MNVIRFAITKDEPIRYLSHLDYMRMMERAMRRSELPVAYTEGFNPHMKIAYATALAVGVTSEDEYMDVEFCEPLSPQTAVEALAVKLPCGVRVLAGRTVNKGASSLMAAVSGSLYTVTASCLAEAAAVETSISTFLNAAQVLFVKASPKKKREIDARALVRSLTAVVNDGTVQFDMDIRITPTGSIKPGDVLTLLAHDFALPVDLDSLWIHRKALYIETAGRRVSPIEFETGEDHA